MSCQNYFVLILAIFRAQAFLQLITFEDIRKSATKSDFHNLVLVTSFNRNIEHISMLLSQFRARTPVFVQVALHQI